MDFQRNKGLRDRQLWRSCYFIKKVMQRILGTSKSTKWLLDASWAISRLAFEASGEMFGNEFHNGSLATNPQILSTIIPSKSTGIDVGCGTGRWSRVVSEFDCEVLGIDYSAKDISTARTLGGNATYLEFDATKKIEDLGKFDFALLIHVLEHIDNPEILLREVRGNCSQLVIEVPDYESNALNWTRRKLGRPYYSDADHVREYSLDLITKQLEATAWKATFMLQKGGAIFIVAE